MVKIKYSKDRKNTSLKDTASKNFQKLLNAILDYENKELTQFEFLKEVSKLLLDFSGSNSIELRIKSVKGDDYEIVRCTKNSFDKIISDKNDSSDFEKFILDMLSGNTDCNQKFFTPKGSLWINNIEKALEECENSIQRKYIYDIKTSKSCESILLITIVIGSDINGIIQFESMTKEYFAESDVNFFEDFSSALGLLIKSHNAQAALRERVKELTCLYGISQAIQKHSDSFDYLLADIVNLLPSAWQYPDITSAKIVLDKKLYLTSSFAESSIKQNADIIINGKKRGYVTIYYSEEKILLYEGPFLKEERHLLDTVARELSIVVEQKEAKDEKNRLYEQLKHADRLATIGQLSAGVAHELNEPLGSILGFAQLLNKNSTLSEGVCMDIQKIVNASLHAREIVRKLLIFSRQMPVKMSDVDLNSVVKEGLFFLESRCVKNGIKLICDYEKDLSYIFADASQLTQVLVNLVVNSIHAMPEGGVLTITTKSADGMVLLIVEDIGEGISEENMDKIFLPFFTTKEVGKGTGLGLSVVNGIITAHKGSIMVYSKVGKGTRIEIKFPAQ